VSLERFTGELTSAAAVTDHLPPPRLVAGGRARGREERRSKDPLLALEPRSYVEALTGLRVGRDGKVSCPFHEDRTPSLHVYETPAGGWRLVLLRLRARNLRLRPGRRPVVIRPICGRRWRGVARLRVRRGPQAPL
jgi:hypothetical protein